MIHVLFISFHYVQRNKASLKGAFLKQFYVNGICQTFVCDVCPKVHFKDFILMLISKAVLLLWIFCGFVMSSVCYVFVRVCLYVLCGHLLGKGWPLGSRLWCLTVSLSLSHRYPVSGVVFVCIDS